MIGWRILHSKTAPDTISLLFIFLSLVITRNFLYTIDSTMNKPIELFINVWNMR